MQAQHMRSSNRHADHRHADESLLDAMGMSTRDPWISWPAIDLRRAVRNGARPGCDSNTTFTGMHWFAVSVLERDESIDSHDTN